MTKEKDKSEQRKVRKAKGVRRKSKDKKKMNKERVKRKGKRSWNN